MPFAKGQSGNLGGRPKALKAIEEVARDHTAEALATLVRVCTDAFAPPAAQVAAANALLDRGWGKPKQAIDAKGTLTLEQLVLASNAKSDHIPPAGPAATAFGEPAG
jgi:hypothetical protein